MKLIGATAMIARGAEPAPWLPDQGDGTYRNPILYADYSDPDAIRVGEDFWMVTSSFNHAPGLPILHSRDLVNWTLVNHALPALVPHEHFATPRHDEGVWAPAIRHHAGRFWIYYPDPDFGIYVITADDPRGAWSKPVLVKKGKGLIDPCPLWDDDGKGYLVHGWAKSRSGISNQLTLHRLSKDGEKLIDEGKVIIDANAMPGWTTLEGPKLYKRGGYYWIFAPAGGVATGYQAVFRSRNIWGPYENRVVLEQGSTAINGPHQGAWVDTPKGENWFLHFQKLPAHGRVVHLQPMKWRDDGWPVMGTDPDDDGKGEPVLTHRKPELPPQAIAAPATSDEFDGRQPGRQWQWQANPERFWGGIVDGALRLTCMRLEKPGTHWLAPHLLLQKFPAPEFTVTTAVRFSPRSDGETAGLMVFGYDYAWLALRQDGGKLRVVLTACEKANQNGTERELASTEAPAGAVILKMSVSADGRCRFSHGSDENSLVPIGEVFTVKPPRWTGAKVGLFATAGGASDKPNHADFDWFRVTGREGR